MIETAADKTADWIYKHSSQSQASKEVLHYALVIYLNGLAIIIVSFLIGAVLGKPAETLLALFAFSLLRAFSGGNHFPTAFSCFLFSVVSFTTVPHIPEPEIWLQYALLTICLILALRYAPNLASDPIVSNKLLPYMKWIAVTIIATNFFITSWVLTLVYLLQCLSLIPWQRR